MLCGPPCIIFPWPLALGPANVRAGLITSSRFSRNHRAHWHACAFSFGMKSRSPIYHGFQSWKEVQESHPHFGQLLSYPHFIDGATEARGGSVNYPESVCFFSFPGPLISLLRVSVKTASTSSFSFCNQIR